MEKKKVVYILGSGATHAVVNGIDSDKGLLTRDIIRHIRNRKRENISIDIWNEVITADETGTDIEHLISILETQHKHYEAELIKTYYRDAIVELSNNISNDPKENNLYSILIDMHQIADLNEELKCFITLNYEDILERTLEKYYNYDIDYIVNSDKIDNTRKLIKIYKLHGSFNWLNTRPISFKEMNKIQPQETLWIPPGIDKKKDNYPFNLLWGKAYEELLNCDVLRIIGCSLSRNDWSLIPMLYTIQKFCSIKSKSLQIEVIDFNYISEKIKENYKYIEIKSIIELIELKEFYRNQLNRLASDSILESEMEGNFSNPFKQWLDAKIGFLVKKEIDIKTEKAIAYNFYNNLNS
ncbi:MAG: SIR2 family protein [Candidatus Delongbacteria bacterium]|jgi:hypothetical protein|nr:SIR2 family protein [Candidatus Delongbacteria bacterium]